MPGGSEPPVFAGYRAEGYPAISSPSRSISMAFTMSGVIAQVPLREGSIVSPGDVVLRLDDDVQGFNVLVQRMTVEDESEVNAAIQQERLAEFDYENVMDLDRQGSAAPREVEQAATELALRRINVTAAKRKRQQNAIVLQREEATLADMTLRSPIHGVVARVEVEVGEAIEGLQPAIHVISVDPLWMDVAIPIQLAAFVEPGSNGVVRWRDVSQDIRCEGVVLWKAPISDASSSTIVVRLEIDNPDRLPAGLHARVQFPEAMDAMRRQGG
jgi:multidrug efflux pump subunit AcrA (membrane-fusion protein)